MKKICVMLALLCIVNGTVLPHEAQRAHQKRTIIACFLTLVAQVACALATKDKDQRIQAATQALASLSLFASMLTGRAEQEQTDEGQKKQCALNSSDADALYEDHQEFLHMLEESCSEMERVLVTVIENA